MANVGGGLLGRSQTLERLGGPVGKDRAGQVVLRANSRRAYAFDHRQAWTTRQLGRQIHRVLRH